MSFSKAPLFDDQTYILSQLCSACSHPARIKIIDRLFDIDDYVTYDDLTEGLPLAKPTLSQHLTRLRNLGIIRSRAVGNKTTEHILNKRNAQVVETLRIITMANKDRHTSNMDV